MALLCQKDGPCRHPIPMPFKPGLYETSQIFNYFFAPQYLKRKSRNRESLELIALTERKESYTLIPSQLR